MAVMSWKKKALGKSWAVKNAQKEANSQSKEMEEKPITEEEHQARINKLKALGIIK